MFGNPCFLEAWDDWEVGDPWRSDGLGTYAKVWGPSGQRVKGATGHLGGPAKTLGRLGNLRFLEAWKGWEVATEVCQGV